MATVLISAGDASGDWHAAAFARALRDRVPDVRLVGLGGEALRKAGVELVADRSDLAVGGIFELAGSARRVLRAWRCITRAAAELRPDLVVLVDSGGFNLPLARRVRRLGDARVLYYVAPQIWAWRRRRLRKIAQRVDRVAVIHPFEPELYRTAGISVEFVGHPMVDELADFRAVCDREEACRRLGLDPGRRFVALLPGSRRNEWTRHLPLALAAARRLHARASGVSFLLALASGVDRDAVASVIEAADLAPVLRPILVHDRTWEAIRASDVVLAKPGTVTVEAMLLERPMVVIGRAHPLTAALVRRLVHVRWLAMPNLVAGRSIVPELLQGDARPDRIAEALAALLDPDAAAAQRRGLAEAAAQLGPGGAAARASAIAEAMLGAGAT